MYFSTLLGMKKKTTCVCSGQAWQRSVSHIRMQPLGLGTKEGPLQHQAFWRLLPQRAPFECSSSPLLLHYLDTASLHPPTPQIQVSLDCMGPGCSRQQQLQKTLGWCSCTSKFRTRLYETTHWCQSRSWPPAGGMILLAKLKGTRSNLQILLMPVHLASIWSTVFHMNPFLEEKQPRVPTLILPSIFLPHL